MAKRTMTVEEHFTLGRSYPTIRRNTDAGAENRIEREPAFETSNSRDEAHNRHDNQMPEDFHDRGYNNDHPNDWVRGGGRGGATGKPSFDRGNSWRSPTKSIHSELSDTQPLRRPVGEK
jgi:hypothetical protein